MSILKKRRSRMKSVCGLAALAAMAFAGPRAMAGGSSFGINIDIQPMVIDALPDSTYGAASGQSGFWNPINPTNSPSASFSLLNLAGAPSGVTIRQTLGGSNTRLQCVGGLVSIQWSKLMCDHAFNVAGVVNPIEYEFNNVPAGTYDLYTYACLPGDSFQPGFAIGVWVNNVYQGTSFISGAVTTSTFQEGRTHDIRNITVGAGQPVRVRVFDTSGEFGDPTGLNGFQLVKLGSLNAAITDPTNIECVCDPVQITGTASGAGFSSYKLEWSQTGNDPWTTIVSSNSPVTNGTLGTWNAGALAEGYYTIRLTVQTGGGLSETATTTVYLNQDFDPIDLRSPVAGQIYGGKVCFDGTVWDQCFSRYQVKYTAPGGGLFDVDPGQPNYFTPVINDPLASWSTNGLPDGNYTVNVTGFNTCGDTEQASASIQIDNTLPVGVITLPAPCSSDCGLINIVGTASDANLDFWTLQYAGAGQSNWVTIATGTTNVISGVLAEWDTSNLQGCCYALRLLVYDKAIVNCGSSRNVTEFVRTFHVGNPLDINGDGQINGADLAGLLANWGPVCEN